MNNTEKYIEKYNKIPRELRSMVWERIGLTKVAISRYKNNNQSIKRKSLIEYSIIDTLQEYNITKPISVKLHSFIRVFHGEEYTNISYEELMQFRIKIEDTIHDIYDIKIIMDQSKASLEKMYKEKEFDFKLLIAKYLLK